MNCLYAKKTEFNPSTILTGEAILFLDLSADPGLFEGPKGDKQVGSKHHLFLCLV